MRRLLRLTFAVTFCPRAGLEGNPLMKSASSSYRQLFLRNRVEFSGEHGILFIHYIHSKEGSFKVSFPKHENARCSTVLPWFLYRLWQTGFETYSTKICFMRWRHSWKEFGAFLSQSGWVFEENHISKPASWMRWLSS